METTDPDTERPYLNSPAAIRDKALILVGFAGGFRRSELVRCELERTSETENGLVIHVPWHKGD